ncbi:MAG: hypothetical protein V2A56_12555 [bacterium]
MPSAIRVTGALAPGWMLLGVLIAFLFAAWSYRWTRPPVSSSTRLLLSVFRGAALTAVWLLVCGFGLSWNRLQARRPNVAVLVDQSESMALSGPFGDRPQILHQIIRRMEDRNLQNSLNITWFGFGESLKNINDISKSIPLTDPVTDAEAAFLSLSRQPVNSFDAVLLLTDGAFNRGGAAVAAARRLHIPVFTIGLGDSLPSRDVQIRSIVAPPYGYAGDPLQIDATVAVNGFPGRETTVQLRDENGNILVGHPFNVSGNVDIHSISFEITPNKPGLQVWSVSIPVFEGESETGNNQRNVAVRIADRKRRVALISGRPDPEAAAWTEVLERDPDTESVIVIGGGKSARAVRGRWEDVRPDSLDGAFVLLAGPYSNEGLAALLSLVTSETPLLVITGASGYSQRALDLLAPRLGRWFPTQEMEKIELVPKRVHPIFTPAGHWFDSGLQSPPVQTPRIEFQDGELIAGGDRERVTRRSVLDLTQSGPRTLLIAAEGVGQWNLALRPQDPEGGEFAKLTDRILRWLTLRTAGQKVHLNLARNLVTQGERTEAILTIQDEALRPIHGANVQGSLQGPNQEEPIRFQETAPGRWTATVRPSTSGRQQVRVNVDLPNGERETQSAELMVDSFRLERTDARMYPERLREIAAVTGGVFATADSADQVVRALPRSKGVREIHGSWLPFGRALTLLLVVAALALEWLVRTRTGMS